VPVKGAGVHSVERGERRVGHGSAEKSPTLTAEAAQGAEFVRKISAFSAFSAVKS
jgi:hypothetical protein